MPIYQYRCQMCGHSMEALQKMADAPLSKCPACGEEALKKQVTAAAFKLKGTGWYETDFKNPRGKIAGNDKAGNDGTGPEQAGEQVKKADASTTVSDTPTPAATAASAD